MARILVVDDDQSIRRSLSAELRAAGHEVAAASDGSEGEEAASRGEYDLVLTDLAMPVADGFSLIAAIRRKSSTPIIVLTGQRLSPLTGLELLEKIGRRSPRTRRLLMTGSADLEPVIDGVKSELLPCYLTKP